MRSNMNIPFTIPSDAALEKEFLQEASKKNMVRPCNRSAHLMSATDHVRTCTMGPHCFASSQIGFIFCYHKPLWQFQ